MSIEDVDARFKAEQAQIDALARQLKDLITAPIDAIADECHRFAVDIGTAKRLIEGVEQTAA